MDITTTRQQQTEALLRGEVAHYEAALAELGDTPADPRPPRGQWVLAIIGIVATGASVALWFANAGNGIASSIGLVGIAFTGLAIWGSAIADRVHAQHRRQRANLQDGLAGAKADLREFLNRVVEGDPSQA